MSTPEPPPYPGDSDPDAQNSGASGLPSYGSVPVPESDEGAYGSVPPPPPPGPPAPPSGAFSAPDAVAWGWLKFTQNVGPVLLASVVIFGVSIGLGIIAGILTGSQQANPLGPGSFSFSAATSTSFIGELVQTVVSLILAGVAAKAALEVTEGKAYDFFGAFGKVNILNLIVASLIVGVLVLIGTVLLVIPGLIVFFLTYLTTYSVVDDGKSPIEAIKHSVSLTSANLGGAFTLAILNVVVMIAGAVALCVGLLVAVPLTTLASAYAYRVFNGQPVAP